VQHWLRRWSEGSALVSSSLEFPTPTNIRLISHSVCVLKASQLNTPHVRAITSVSIHIRIFVTIPGAITGPSKGKYGSILQPRSFGTIVDIGAYCAVRLLASSLSSTVYSHSPNWKPCCASLTSTGRPSWMSEAASGSGIVSPVSGSLRPVSVSAS
jgi:hypothetical protein